MKLVLRKTDVMDDWYIIERAEHDGREWEEQTGPNTFSFRKSARICDSCVEGPGEHMIGLAKAIRERRSESFKRCGIFFDKKKTVAYFTSPRNSDGNSEACTLEEVDDLASQIERGVAHAAAG